MQEAAAEDVPLLAPENESPQRHDGHFVCNIEGPVVRGFNSTFQQQLRELFSLIVYYAQFATLLATVVLLFKAGAWQWATAALVLTTVHHVVLSVVLMVRNGWVQTAWNYCCGVFMFNPMEGFDFLEEGCIGIIVAGACWLMYLALALMGLGFLSYCLLCYLATALVFSLLLMDLSLLTATLLQASSAPLLAPSELLYIENFRISRLTLLAALQSLPLLLLVPPALAAAYLLPSPPFSPPAGTPIWLIPLCLTLALLSVLDTASLLGHATRASGTTLPLYLSYILQLRGAVKVPPALMPTVVREMIRADGCLRVSNSELDMERWPQVACQLVPGYLLPMDADRLEPCQLVAALREACSAVMDAVGRSRPDSCNRIPMPRLVLEADLGAQHSAEALLLGLRALEGLESISVLGGRLGGPRFWEVGRQMAAHFFLTEMRLADVRIDATALNVLSHLLSGPHCSPLARLEILRATLPKGSPPWRAPKSHPASSLTSPLIPRSGLSTGASSAGGLPVGAAAARGARGDGGDVEEEEICEEGVQASFFAALASNSTLKYLSLSGTPLEASAVAALCKVLQRPSALTHLDLSFCGLGLDGAQTLAAALSTAPRTLNHLAIAPSDATPLGTAALVRIAQARLAPPTAPRPPAAGPLPPTPHLHDTPAPNEAQLRHSCQQLYFTTYTGGLLLEGAPSPLDLPSVTSRLTIARDPDGRVQQATFDLQDLMKPPQDAPPADHPPATTAEAAGALPHALTHWRHQAPTAAAAAADAAPSGVPAPHPCPPEARGGGWADRPGPGGAPEAHPLLQPPMRHAQSPTPLDPLMPRPQSPAPPHPFGVAPPGGPLLQGNALRQMAALMRQEGGAQPPLQPPMHRAQSPTPLDPLADNAPPATPQNALALAIEQHQQQLTRLLQNAQLLPQSPDFRIVHVNTPAGTQLIPFPATSSFAQPHLASLLLQTPGFGANPAFTMVSPGLWEWRAPSPPPQRPPLSPSRPLSPEVPDITMLVTSVIDSVVPVTGLPGVAFHCLQDFSRLTSGNWLANAPPALPGGLTLSLLCFEDPTSTLVQAPVVLPGLVNLDFRNIHLTDTHVALLGQSLPACPTLTRLSLTSADIDDSRMQLLAAALPSAKSLVALSISGNAVGPLGGLALCRAIPALPHFTLLYMRNNLHPLPIDVLNGLADLMAARPHLKISIIHPGHWGPTHPWLTLTRAAAATTSTAPEPTAAMDAATSAEVDAAVTADAPPPGSDAVVVTAASTSAAAQEMVAPGEGPADGSGTEQGGVEGAAEAEMAVAAAGAGTKSGSVSSGGSECGICCDSTDTVAMEMCQHHVCAACYRNIHQTSGPRHPFTCPYCRAPIIGYRYLRLPAALQAAPYERIPNQPPTPLVKAMQDAVQAALEGRTSELPANLRELMVQDLAAAT